MFATVIVPLDGSAQAEAALPFAIEETVRHAARLLLVRVLPRPEPAILTRNHGGPAPVIPVWPQREVATDERRSLAYLRDVCDRFGLGIDTRLVVAVGDPGARLLAEALMHPRPLVVLATGDADPRSPLSGLARRLLTADAIPVLVVRQPTPANETPILAHQLPDRYFRHVVTPHPPLAVTLPAHDGSSLVAVTVGRVPLSLDVRADSV
jgi:nucleotide-binding universal stress UspA family protein